MIVQPMITTIDWNCSDYQHDSCVLSEQSEQENVGIIGLAWAQKDLKLSLTFLCSIRLTSLTLPSSHLYEIAGGDLIKKHEDYVLSLYYIL